MRQILFSLALLLIITSCTERKKDWYMIKQLDKRTYVISEVGSSQGNSSFLIMGDKEAILFDSGSGENREKSMFEVVDSLTQLPTTLLMSHFHFDHVGGVNDFKTIGLPAIELLTSRLSADSLLNLNRTDVLADNTVSLKIGKIFPVEEEIDLGNRMIKILHTPGHSKESITIIDLDSKSVFTGDLVYNGLLLVNDCNAYQQSISSIENHSDAAYRVYGSHGKPEVDYVQLSQIKNALSSYLANDSSFESVRQINFFGSTKEVYKKENVAFIVGYTDVFNQ